MPLDNLSKSGTPPSCSTGKGEVSIANIPKDQLEAFALNMVNAIAAKTARSQSPSEVEKNLQDLQRRLSSLSNQIRFEVNGQELNLCIKALEVSSDLPIFFREDIKDTIDLSTPLPATLQELKSCATILELLKISFPKLTSSFFFNKKTEISRFVVSSPIPLNQEGKGVSFFPQIEAEGQIAYVAWDSSGSKIAKGFKEKKCDILLKDKETFCGVALSQDNLEGIEKGAGVSDHFMTSKVTVIGILVTNSSESKQSWWFGGGRVACDSPELSNRDASGFRDLCCDDLNERGCASKSDLTTFGMLGAQGGTVSSNLQNLPDRPKKPGETLHPFCLEIVPQFSSKQNPVKEDALLMAVEALLQEKIFAQLKKN